MARADLPFFRSILSRRARPDRGRIRELDCTPDLHDKHFLFVSGLHRSGTSILHRHLSEHDDISGFHGTGVPEDEGQHVQNVLPTARDHGGPGRFAFHPQAHMCEDEALSMERDSRDRLLRQWGAQWDLGRPVLVEKSPPTLTRARFFQELFPNSSFVFLVRHPIAVSFATQRWARRPLHELMRHWSRAHELMLGDLAGLRRAQVVRYEDYVRSPVSTLAVIYDMVGLAAKVPQEKTFDANRRYFDRWSQCAGQELEVSRAFEDKKGAARRFGYLAEPPFVERSWDGLI
jgi:hypothetical protein